MKAVRLGVVISLVASLGASPVFSSSAIFHLMKIVEVFPGTAASPNAQYVELQMYESGQNFVAGHQIHVYNANGVNIGMFTFGSNVPNGDNQDSILIGTTQAAAFFGVTMDLVMTPILPRAGGKVCFDDPFPIDCVAWGGYVGSSAGVGTPFNVPVGLLSGRAIHRNLGSNGILEDIDDTDNSSVDFSFGSPVPRNNARTVGVPPPSTCSNTIVEGLEGCDDGNLLNGDGCSSTCQLEPAAVVPNALVVNPTGNGVFEPGETAQVEPAWQNNGTSSITLTGTASTFSGPAGPTYGIVNNSANYGTVGPGVTRSCATLADCYTLSINGTRPAAHWDATLAEVLSNGGLKYWSLHLGQSFADVPTSHLFYRFIETIFHKGVTAGCTANTYCPDDSVTRAQMAIFLLRASLGASYMPPPATGNIFDDVETTTPAADWIEDLYNRGITGGCSANPPLYCPNAAVRRDQMAVFLLRTKEGSTYTPPPCVGTFTDVPCSSFFAPWIEELFERGITSGCSVSPPQYCPGSPNTRGQMAVFLSRTFNLLLYGP